MVAGYNLLNEPVTDKTDMLKKYYKDAIKEIHSVDKNHLIFLDGNCWSQDSSFLDNSFGRQIVLSPHYYHPIILHLRFCAGTKVSRHNR